jgi:hypothetical protein
METNRIAMAAIFGLASALSACGSKGNTAPASAERPAATSNRATPAEAPASVERPPIATDSTANVTTKANPADLGPTIPAAELRRRILSLLESVRERRNVSRANVELLLGVRLIENPELRGHWELRGGTDLPLRYGLIVIEDQNPKEDLPVIHLLVPGEAALKPRPPTAILCPYELEEMVKDIAALGYARKPGWNDPRGHVYFKWETPARDYGVTIQVFKYVQNPDATRNAHRYCVENIIVMAGVFEHE